MTVFYGELRYHLADDDVQVEAPGCPPERLDPATLPLPVQRSLRQFRAGISGIHQ
jgi:hypothetical protein